MSSDVIASPVPQISFASPRGGGSATVRGSVGLPRVGDDP